MVIYCKVEKTEWEDHVDRQKTAGPLLDVPLP